MLLYHYSENSYPTLKSRALQSNVIAEDEKDYTNHISFFLEPIPLDLPEILEHRHSFWRSGKTLYEHIVDTKDLPNQDNLLFYLTETPEKVDIVFYSQLAKNDKDPKYWEAVNKVKGEFTGRGVDDLIKMTRNYNSGIADYYRNLVKMDKEFPKDDLLQYYAACVPHLMVYTCMDPVKVRTIRRLKLH